MKYIKTYEGLKKPEIGDYVVCEEDVDELTPKKDYIDVHNFTSNNVGVYVIHKNNTNNDFHYVIKYENIPEELEIDFMDDDTDNYNEFTSCRRMSLGEIVYWSKDKEDCEVYLSTKKYNI